MTVHINISTLNLMQVRIRTNFTSARLKPKVSLRLTHKVRGGRNTFGYPFPLHVIEK